MKRLGFLVATVKSSMSTPTCSKVHFDRRDLLRELKLESVYGKPSRKISPFCDGLVSMVPTRLYAEACLDEAYITNLKKRIYTDVHYGHRGWLHQRLPGGWSKHLSMYCRPRCHHGEGEVQFLCLQSLMDEVI